MYFIITSEFQQCHPNTTDENGYIFYDDGTNAYLMGYTGSETALTLPEKSPSGKNYEIYFRAFYRNTRLASITIPASVTGIGTYAFYDCTSLASITVPEGATSTTASESVMSIGSSAFSGCTSLASVTIGNSVTEIGDSAFSRCYTMPSSHPIGLRSKVMA